MTVEDMVKGGDQYLMDEKDVVFLEKYNHDYKNNKLSEDKFEDIMHQIESVVSYQLPHLSLVSKFVLYIPYLSFFFLKKNPLDK